ncbi:mutator family transposase [Mycobacterium tuberculosis]|nr:mutator family transposase [Mycobacterium tuberculosis]
MERLVETLGVTKLSKSQVSIMAKELDEAVEAFRTRPLDAGPYTFLAADALVLKVREAGRVVGVHTLIATGVNAEGYREILGIQVTSAEDGAGWLAFFRDLVARGLSGVALVTSDAHAGLVAAIGATLPAAAWQRCRTHYAANLMAATPKPSWPWVRTLLHSIYDQPDAESVVAQYDRVLDALTDKLPAVAEPLDTPAPTCWRSPPSPSRSGAKSGPTTPRNASTERYDAEPTSWASSPTAPRSSASSEPSSPNNTTNGSKDGATWASRSSPEPEQH